MFISRNILKLNCPSLHPISNEVVFDLYVFLLVMKYWILREFDTTLIIAVNNCRPQLMTKWAKQQLAKPNDLAASLTSCQPAMYSASTELSATDLCFQLNQEITVDPNSKQHPEVLFLSIVHPA
jgi:hypothetical protein